MKKKINSNAYVECAAAIRRLLSKEESLKRQLAKIEKEKMLCIRVLSDDKYCEEILRGENERVQS